MCLVSKQQFPHLNSNESSLVSKQTSLSPGSASKIFSLNTILSKKMVANFTIKYSFTHASFLFMYDIRMSGLQALTFEHFKVNFCWLSSLTALRPYRRFAVTISRSRAQEIVMESLFVMTRGRLEIDKSVSVKSATLARRKSKGWIWEGEKQLSKKQVP